MIYQSKGIHNTKWKKNNLILTEVIRGAPKLVLATRIETWETWEYYRNLSGFISQEKEIL